jgi:hypothetical protein
MSGSDSFNRLLKELPTTQASRGEIDTTSVSMPTGPETRFQMCPSQRRMPVEPTAHALCALSAATLVSPPPAGTPGLGSHEVPFQCRIRARWLADWPTAQTLPADTAATPDNEPRGPAICCQDAPFQCTINVRPPFVPPTAHALRADITATSASLPPVVNDVRTAAVDAPLAEVS